MRNALRGPVSAPPPPSEPLPSRGAVRRLKVRETSTLPPKTWLRLRISWGPEAQSDARAPPGQLNPTAVVSDITDTSGLGHFFANVGQGQLHYLWGPLFLGGKVVLQVLRYKLFSFLLQSLSWFVMVFPTCHLMRQSLGH